MIRFLALLLALLAPAMAQARDGLVVMSFNVRLPSPSDGANIWENRRDLFVETIAAADPDVIGTQELFRIQGDYLVAKLPQYSWFGIDRRGGHADEHMGVFYRRDRLKLIEQGDFWLSDTPEQVASISWGNLYPRMVTWGLFETRSGKRFYLLNTHFPYRAEDASAREKCAALLRKRIAALPRGVPVVLTGDFNTGPDSAPHALLGEILADARDAVAKPLGPEATFHGFKGVPDHRIDWILTRGFKARGYRTIDAHRGALYPSDHFPVVATLAWPGVERPQDFGRPVRAIALSMSADFTIDVDPARDLVRIRMGGFFTSADIDAFLAERAMAHAQLTCGPNRHLTLNDLRDMKIQAQESVEMFRAMLADPAHRSRRLAFVIGRTLARTQLQRALDRRIARCFDDPWAAEAWLFAGSDRAAA